MGLFDRPYAGIYPDTSGSSGKKKRYFSGELFLRDRTSTRKSTLKKTAESGKQNRVFKKYRIVKENGKYSLYIKP